MLGFGGAGLLLLAAFVMVELRTPEPLIDVRLFRNRMFAVANLTQSVAFMGFSATLFLLPLFLQLERGLSPLQSGLATFPQAIGVMLMALVVTRIYPIVGPRRIVVIGLLIASATTVPLVLMDLGTDLWWVRGTMFVRGVGFGMMLRAPADGRLRRYQHGGHGSGDGRLQRDAAGSRRALAWRSSRRCSRAGWRTTGARSAPSTMRWRR